MMLDMEQWYLLSQPLFENIIYLSTLADVTILFQLYFGRRIIAFLGKRFFQSVETSCPTRSSLADKKED
jgi:hypothetical protein